MLKPVAPLAIGSEPLYAGIDPRLGLDAESSPGQGQAPAILPAGEISDFNGQAQVADRLFPQPDCPALAELCWWGTYRSDSSPGTDDFTLRVFASEGASPAERPALEVRLGEVQRIDTGLKTPTLGLDLYAYRATIPGAPTLTPGSSASALWLSLINETLRGDWGWMGLQSRGNAQFRRGDVAAAWTSLAGSVAFWLVP